MVSSLRRPWVQHGAMYHASHGLFMTRSMRRQGTLNNQQVNIACSTCNAHSSQKLQGLQHHMPEGGVDAWAAWTSAGCIE